VDLYDVAVNVKRARRERNNYFNEQCGITRKGDQQESFHSQEPYKRPPGNHYSNNMCEGQHLNTRPRVAYNTWEMPGHYALECH